MASPARETHSEHFESLSDMDRAAALVVNLSRRTHYRQFLPAMGCDLIGIDFHILGHSITVCEVLCCRTTQKLPRDLTVCLVVWRRT